MGDFSPVDVSVSPVDKFREFLSIKGKRLTQERAIIVEEVFSTHEHFDPDQLIEQLTQRLDSKRVSRSTVYRTLTGLVEAGLLRKVARTNDRDVYEHDYGYPEHDHLICDKCGQMIEFPNQDISGIVNHIASQHGFLVGAHRLEVYGTCSDCVARPKRRPGTLDLM